MRLLAISSTYLLSYLAINWYGADIYGQYVMLLGLFLQLSIFGKFGYDLSLTRHLSSNNTKSIPKELIKRVLRNVIFIFCSLIFLFSCVFFLDLEWFSDYDLIYTLPFLGLFACFSLSMFISGGLRGLGKVSQFALINITSRPLLTLIVLALLYFYLPSGNNIFYAHIIAISTVLAISVFLAYQNGINVKCSDTDISEFTNYNRLLFYSTIIYVVFTTGDRILLGIYSDPAVVAQYDISLKLAMLMIIVIEALNTYFSPIFSRLQDNIAALKIEVKRSTRLTVILSLIALIIVVITARYILDFYGFNEVRVYQSVVIVCLSFFISSFCGQALSIIQMTGNLKGFIIKMLLSVLGSFGLALFLVPLYGIIGMSISFGLGYISLMFLAAIHLKQKLDLNSFSLL